MDKKQIGQILADRRKEMGLTQAEVAQITHIRIATISDMEQGKSNFSIETFLTVLGLLSAKLTIELYSKPLSQIIDMVKNTVFLPSNSKELYDMTDPENRWLAYIKEQALLVEPKLSDEHIGIIQDICIGKAIQETSKKQ